MTLIPLSNLSEKLKVKSMGFPFFIFSFSLFTFHSINPARNLFDPSLHVQFNYTRHTIRRDSDDRFLGTNFIFSGIFNQNFTFATRQNRFSGSSRNRATARAFGINNDQWFFATQFGATPFGQRPICRANASSA